MTTEKIALEYSLPLDLTFEILLRLPPKSVLRFKSVSKSWYSIISSQQFIDAFMALSLSRPRLVLLLKNHDEDRVLFFSSLHQSCSFSSSSSMSVAIDNTLTMPKFKFNIDYICNSVRGFLCCRIREGFVVCNPSTGQIIPIAEDNSGNYYYDYPSTGQIILIAGENSDYMYLGYDPNSDQYKVLRLKSRMSHARTIQYSVLTLGGQGSSHSWRPIKTNNPDYACYPNGVCIDGVLYYKSIKIENYDKAMLSCFDVGSEQLRDIETPENVSGYITNYLGKLAMHCFIVNGFNLWVLDDVKNQIWSKKTYDFPLFNEISMPSRYHIEGITASGEIVYSQNWFHDPFELFSYNMEKKMGRRVRVTRLSDYVNRSTLEDSPFYYSSLLCSYVDSIIYL